MKSWWSKEQPMERHTNVIVSTYAFSKTSENSYDVTDQIVRLWHQEFEQYLGYLKFTTLLANLGIATLRCWCQELQSIKLPYLCALCLPFWSKTNWVEPTCNWSSGYIFILLQGDLLIYSKKKKDRASKMIQILADHVAKHSVYKFSDIDSSDLCLFL